MVWYSHLYGLGHCEPQKLASLTLLHSCLGPVGFPKVTNSSLKNSTIKKFCYYSFMLKLFSSKLSLIIKNYFSRSGIVVKIGMWLKKKKIYMVSVSFSFVLL